jgi:hypothetical protein
MNERVLYFLCKRLRDFTLKTIMQCLNDKSIFQNEISVDCSEEKADIKLPGNF